MLSAPNTLQTVFAALLTLVTALPATDTLERQVSLDPSHVVSKVTELTPSRSSKEARSAAAPTRSAMADTTPLVGTMAIFGEWPNIVAHRRDVLAKSDGVRMGMEACLEEPS